MPNFIMPLLQLLNKLGLDRPYPCNYKVCSILHQHIHCTKIIILTTWNTVLSNTALLHWSSSTTVACSTIPRVSLSAQLMTRPLIGIFFNITGLLTKILAASRLFQLSQIIIHRQRLCTMFGGGVLRCECSVVHVNSWRIFPGIFFQQLHIK